jgi:hypothetical protein
VKKSALVIREREFEDGGQSGTEQIKVCPKCADVIDGKQVA